MVKGIRIGDRQIGDGAPCFVIAEAGANWRYCDDVGKNYEHALKLIDIATKANADAVKFQIYRAKRMYTKSAGFADYIGKEKSIYRIIEEMEVPYEWLPKLKEYCDKKDIIFLATPFDEKSADELEAVGMDAYKIASYTINHLPLLEYIAELGKPMIMSTGASSIKDIKDSVECVKKAGNNKLALMQCTAKYPAPLDTLNLRAIPELKKRFNVPVGFSDHSREPLPAPLGAVALGADLIEKHYTTDNALEGPDHGFAILPHELKELVTHIRQVEESLGSGEKIIQDGEKELYEFARRSIHAVREIKKGETLTSDNIAVLRPGKVKPGLEPKFLDKVLGKKAKGDIMVDEGISWDMLE